MKKYSNEEKIAMFQDELEFIMNDDIRKFTENILCALPDYFFVVSSSSSGKYHPDYAKGEGGLVRHSKAAARIGNYLTNLACFQTYDERKKINHDIVVSSLILHDGMKRGTTNEGRDFTVATHPQKMKNFIIENVYEFTNNDKINISTDDILLICSCIECHMGEWGKDTPLPLSEIEKIVCYSDYLSSRKDIEFKFDEIGE